MRFEQDAPNTSSSSTMHVSPEYREGQDRPQPVLVHNSGHVDDDIQISALDRILRYGLTKELCIKEVFDGYREEDAGDLRRIALD